MAQTIHEVDTETKKMQTQITDLQSQINALEEQKKELANMHPHAQLAIELHERFCTWNHTDGCCWHYEITKGKHNWNSIAHLRYLKKAEKLAAYAEKHDVDPYILFAMHDLVKGL